MESLSCVVLATAIFLLIFKFLKDHHDRKNLPPGPRPWPLIGNLNLIGPHPHKSLHELSQTYGKLMLLRFGSSPVVVASSPDMARQILRTHDPIFASRPPMAAGKHNTYNYRDLLWAPFGAHWKQGRKIFLNELFSTKRLDSFECIRVQEMKLFRSSLASSRDPIKLKKHIVRLNLGVICRIVLGRKYLNEQKDEKEMMTIQEFQDMLEEWFLLNGVLNIGDWIPWMKFIDMQGYVRRMKSLYKRFDWFHDLVVEDHKGRKEAEGEGFVAKDLVDVLLKLANNPNLEVQLDSDGIKGFIQVCVRITENCKRNNQSWL